MCVLWHITISFACECVCVCIGSDEAIEVSVQCFFGMFSYVTLIFFIILSACWLEYTIYANNLQMCLHPSDLLVTNLI